ncbi:uncharacterized protein TNCV_2787651 [Trichonephila clavipes]|uniref:Uncharacterized protein n=1 Tax=Trichonephila clavipes TaxID=2585209 RepID=A0A8X6VKU9_TRICX|nr:uncharacterized protein TNCV_2787651 [Trichonephila clavipes]
MDLVTLNERVNINVTRFGCSRAYGNGPLNLQPWSTVMRPILAYGCPVWGYAAKTNIIILDALQNSTIRMIVKATRYMRNDDTRKAIKINSFKSHIQKIAKKFF